MIAGTTIRQDDQGRYCLNDLHKASGGEARFKPANWLRTDQASELEAELSSSHIRELNQNQPVNVINGGNDRGTYVCKELVYAYAMWISAKFHLQVIRTFDAVVTGQLQPQGQHKLPQTYAEALRALADTSEELDLADFKFNAYVDNMHNSLSTFIFSIG